jgi:hypothetical protein
MKQKYHYDSPAIVRVIQLHTTGELLSGSVVDNANIRAVGQEVQDYDFTSGNTDGFNHTWE